MNPGPGSEHFGVIKAWAVLLVLAAVQCFPYIPRADDFRFMALTSEFGVLGTTVQWYQEYGGRWFSYSFASLAFRIQNEAPGIMLATLIILFLYALWYFLKTFFEDAVLPFLTAGMFFLLFLPGRIESVFWLSSAVIHLSGLSFLLLLAAMHFRGEKSWKIFLLMLPFSGSSELLGIVYLSGLVFFGLTQKKILWYALCFAGLLSVNVFSPGSWARLMLLHTETQAWIGILKGCGLAFLKVLPWMILLSPLCFLLGYLGKASAVKLQPVKPLKRIIIYSYLLCALTLPPIIVFRDLPPDRVLMPFYLAMIFITYYEGYAFKNKYRNRPS